MFAGYHRQANKTPLLSRHFIGPEGHRSPDNGVFEIFFLSLVLPYKERKIRPSLED